ncbi:spermatogenesis associated 2-like [Eucyclogobius newberryi]|uniref:spermatogenesis associated 2-like n=1 Tax=Eucyclogobius newberryi TaxID=166745 RepID=UPI003B58FFF7
MTMTGQRTIDLMAAYNHFLEKQIVDRGSSLPCRDEMLCNEVDELLKSEGSDAHCLGLDTFNIMEESLQSDGTDCRRPAKVQTGLNGLAKAFEVLEQAALNLHLGPWREEYKVVKMYSGIFTHCIKPVFSTQQIELLFGLLGYRLCSSRREQLRLQPQKVSAARVDELLRLSCAFFVARCECRLLLAALGKYAGQPRWELNIVRERQRGHSFQMALDSTMRLVDVKQPLQELPEENDMDLYTDELEGERLRETSVDESPRSLTWMPDKSANGLSREPVYISNYLKKPSADPNANDFLSASRGVSQFYNYSGEPMVALPVSFEEKTDHESCYCLEVKRLILYKCKECQTHHHVSCPKLEPCNKNHTLELIDEIPEQFIPMRAAASHRRGSISPTLTNCTDTFSSLSLHNDSESTTSFISPLALHSCCEGPNQDPQSLCFRCQVFHSDYCNEAKICLNSHEAKRLGLCSVGKCSQKTHMLCKYCGDERCKDCWYKSPLNCRCGQSFDFSSSV